MTQQLQPFDFHDIAALDDTAVALRRWVSKSSSFFADFWSEVSDFDAQLSLGSIRTESYGTLIESTPRTSIACLADFDGITSSVWYMSTEDLRLMFSEMLGQSETYEAITPELSPIEYSLATLFVEELARSLTDGWMGTSEILIRAQALGKDPRKTRVFRAKDLVWKTSIEVKLNSATPVVHWLMTKQQTSDLLETAIDQRKSEDPKYISDAMVQQLPINLVSLLGQATVPIDRLANLTVGETILLDQRIDRPVKTFVNDELYYKCWPGQVASQQAIEIAECLQTQEASEQ